MTRLLRAKREGAGLSQRELARRVGWSQARVYQTEVGHRRLDLIELFDLLGALGIPALEFIAELTPSPGAKDLAP